MKMVKLLSSGIAAFLMLATLSVGMGDFNRPCSLDDQNQYWSESGSAAISMDQVIDRRRKKKAPPKPPSEPGK